QRASYRKPIETLRSQRFLLHRLRNEARIMFLSLGEFESPTRQRGAEAVIPSLALRAFKGHTPRIPRATALAQLAEQLPYASNGLLNALLIFHQSKAYEVIAVFSKANPRADGDLGLLQKQFSKFQRAHGFKSFRYFSP